MYKNLFGTILGVVGLMGILAICPQITQAYNDGIYTGLVDENGSGVITVIFGGNDTFSGVEMTLKVEDQTGSYYRGFNKDTTQSYIFFWNASGCTGTYYSGDGKLAGCTNGVNNVWGGSGDIYENGFNPIPDNFEARQGPCDSGYHVPSRGERNALAIAWCNIDTGCNARYGTSGGVAGDLKKAINGTSGNRLIYIENTGLGDKFKDEFNMFDGYFWSSSPFSDDTRYSWRLYLSTNSVYPDSVGHCNGDYHVRCIKNFIVEPPQTFTLSFLDDGIEVASGSVVSGEVRSGTIPTLDEKEGYEFDYRYADGIDTEFDFTSPITGDVKLHAHWTITAKIPNGIYTGLNGGDITVVWNDEIRGSINLTLAGSELEGYYKRGFNYDTNRSIWSGSDGLGTYIGEDGKMYGNTYGVNDARGGSGDNYENGFDDGNERYKRQGPCPVGYHIPSRGERNALTIARCNLDTLCNKIFTMQHASGWTDSNKLIFINGGTLGNRIKSSFNLTTPGLSYWSSSPNFDSVNKSWTFYFDPDYIHPDSNNDRAGNYFIRARCFKNYITVPQTFTITFLNGNEHVWSGDIVLGDKIPEEIISGYNLTGLTKEGYTFSGWIISGSDEKIDVENDIITTGMILNTVWQINQYTITFKDGNNEITSITADYGTGITLPPNPTKNGYTFKGRDKPIPSTMPAEDMIISAKWERNGSSGGGGGGGGGGGSSKTDTGSTASQTGNQINSNTGDTASTGNIKEPVTNTGSNIQTGSQQPLSPTDSSPDREQTVTPLIGGDSEARGGGTQTYTQEFQEAYEFAKGNGITTMPTIQKANMEGMLTRIAMAKMLSQYAMNVLGQKPANIITPKFNDVTDKQNSDYDDGVTLAYQLGIMGQNMPGNNFRPNDEVTRAEFATALSRMAYGTSDGEYKGTAKYYIHHMEKLVREGIITNDDPNMKELRGYVMIMLMRSSK